MKCIRCTKWEIAADGKTRKCVGCGKTQYSVAMGMHSQRWDDKPPAPKEHPWAVKPRKR